MKRRMGMYALAAALIGLTGGCAWLNEPCNCGSHRMQPEPATVTLETQPA